jgi:prepilin-type N-terminal cleavage/methylation domain-containing protein
MKSYLRKNTGFTMLEAIVVMLIVGIVGAAVAARMVISNPELEAQAEVTKTHIRYAQIQAMNSDTVWGIHCEGATYWLFKDSNKDNKVLLPGEDNDTVDLSAKNLTMTGFTDLSFNSWGAPHTDEAASEANKLSTALNITISSAEQSTQIVITPNTGFIP